MKEDMIARRVRMNRLEDQLASQGYLLVAGVDEAGRGPLAGPVVAAAVILNPADPIIGLNDSKKLSAKRRSELFEQILNRSTAHSIAYASVQEIGELNILEATRAAMRRAVDNLNPPPDYVLYDYIQMEPNMVNCEFIKKGDSVSNSIAAASILAKVSRDRYMEELAFRYPDYRFDKHKGYGTKAHYDELDRHGPCAEHRELFLRSWREKNGSV